MQNCTPCFEKQLCIFLLARSLVIRTHSHVSLFAYCTVNTPLIFQLSKVSADHDTFLSKWSLNHERIRVNPKGRRIFLICQATWEIIFEQPCLFIEFQSHFSPPLEFEIPTFKKIVLIGTQILYTGGNSICLVKNCPSTNLFRVVSNVPNGIDLDPRRPKEKNHS